MVEEYMDNMADANTAEKNREFTMYDKNGDTLFRQGFNDITEIDLYEAESLAIQNEGRYEVTDKETGLIISKENSMEIMREVNDELNMTDMDVEIPFPFSNNELHQIAENILHYGIRGNDLPRGGTDMQVTETGEEQINAIAEDLKSRNADTADKYEAIITDAHLRVHDSLEKASPEQTAGYNELQKADKETDATAQAVHRLYEIELANRERAEFRNAAEKAAHRFQKIGQKEKENFIKKYEGQKAYSKTNANHKEKMLYRMIMKERRDEGAGQKQNQAQEKQMNRMRHMQGRPR